MLPFRAARLCLLLFAAVASIVRAFLHVSHVSETVTVDLKFAALGYVYF